MNIYINASNIHAGGGKVILNELIGAVTTFKDIEFIVFVDCRFDLPVETENNIVFLKVLKTMRWRVSHLIEKQTNKNDIVIYLTNLPPIIRHKCKTILVQQNRFVIDNFTLSGFSIKTRIRINFEKLLFWLNNKNTDYIVVQSQSMFNILKNNKINEDKIKIIAYKKKENQNKTLNLCSNHEKLKTSFIYIASGEPHKNHINLIEAWCLLSKNSIYPKLTITIDENTNLHRHIIKKVNEYKLDVEIIPNMERENIINLYIQSTALIYPSFFESYGLPLVEADQYGMAVIASELDYVRDIIDPVETFDPNSAKSICRSVKRFMKIEEKKTEIVSPVEFINKVINL